jgi:hypothetical protein
MYPAAVAVSADVFFVDLGCNIYFMGNGAYSKLQPTKNMNTSCTPRFMGRLNVGGTESCTGLSPALRSNVGLGKVAGSTKCLW